MKLQRGDVVIVASPGDFGKPRPAVVVQSNLLSEAASVIVCQITSFETATPLYRLMIDPLPANGLEHRSWVMVEKLAAMRLNKVGKRIGALTDDQMAELDALLMIVLGLAPGT